MAEREDVWRIKLLAWTHDPAEKALILMRGPESHEEAVQPLRQALGLHQAAEEELALVRRADHWASALDRPQHPEEFGRLPKEVHFWEEPELVHPLAGDRYRLSELWEDSRFWIELASFEHVRDLLMQTYGENQCAELSRERAFLSLWRLAPAEAPDKLKLGHLWRLLPADTRVPDHSIWEHLALTSAFATSFVFGDLPALLRVSLGPVQGFIEQARTLSDLWSGSHLLSYLAWQAIKPVAEEFGPDVVIYPSLWEVPLVDAWLKTEKGIPINLAWWQSHSDANPLFRAALPNVFVAIVPEKQIEQILRKIQDGIKQALATIALKTAEQLLLDADESRDREKVDTLRLQIERDVATFPELNYAWVPFSLVADGREGIHQEGYKKLQDLLHQVREGTEADTGSFLYHPFWRLLEKKAGLDGEWTLADDNKGLSVRYRPNPGSLYPALRELADDYLALAKVVREFPAAVHEGYRCDLCGEREWLRLPEQEDLLYEPPGARRAGGQTLWSRVTTKSIWGRKGEHLCGRCAIKRFWPTYFSEQVGQWKKKEAAGEAQRVPRFVVSTHTMALARDLEGLFEGWESFQQRKPGELDRLKSWTQGLDSVALPRKLASALTSKKDLDSTVEQVIRRLPTLLEEAKSSELALTEGAPDEFTVKNTIKDLLGHHPENYYGLILMDGDRMGQWVSGDPEVMIPLKECWHSKVSDYVQKLNGGADLLNCPRPGSAAHHQALSGALNAFAVQVAPWVVEELFLGRLIYCGGDDLLAMVSVDELLPCMFMLRCAFSGILPLGDKNAVWSLYRQLKGIQDEMRAEGDVIARGYVRKKRSLVWRVLGGRATASMGAVVAHHMSPLSAVVRQLRSAEKDAKNYGRNSFSIYVLKRAGGRLSYTARWGFGGTDQTYLPYRPEEFKAQTEWFRSPMSCLLELRDALALPGVSRRAVFHAVAWLQQMPGNPVSAGMELKIYESMLWQALAYQLRRHGLDQEAFREAGLACEGDPAARLARELVAVALRECQSQEQGIWRQPVPEHLAQMLQVAEFLAREGRANTA